MTARAEPMSRPAPSAASVCRCDSRMRRKKGAAPHSSAPTNMSSRVPIRDAPTSSMAVRDLRGREAGCEWRRQRRRRRGASGHGTTLAVTGMCGGAQVHGGRRALSRATRTPLLTCSVRSSRSYSPLAAQRVRAAMQTRDLCRRGWTGLLNGRAPSGVASGRAFASPFEFDVSSGSPTKPSTVPQHAKVLQLLDTTANSLWCAPGAV